MKTAKLGLVALALCWVSAAAMAGGECCEKAKAGSAWCNECKVGFVCGVEVRSKTVHAAFSGAPAAGDAKCDGCTKAMAADGACNACGVSFAGKKMYRSPFGWALAKGAYTPEADLKCDACKKGSAKGAWCDKCKQGVSHGFVFKDKAGFEQAMKAHKVVSEAGATKCDGCGVAMATNGRCDVCKVNYMDGKKVAAADKPADKGEKKEAAPTKP